MWDSLKDSSIIKISSQSFKIKLKVPEIDKDSSCFIRKKILVVIENIQYDNTNQYW